jgi:hypothetical protein
MERAMLSLVKVVWKRIYESAAGETVLNLWGGTFSQGEGGGYMGWGGLEGESPA